MKILQYQSLRKCAGAPYGTAQAAVDRITGVEPIEAKLDVMQARFVARSLGPSSNGRIMAGRSRRVTRGDGDWKALDGPR